MLEVHESQCEPNARIVVCKDKRNRCKYHGKNEARNLVRKYRIDGDVICGTECQRCDFLVLNDDRKRAFLIEFKACGHVVDALPQFASTEKLLAKELQGYQHFYRIIYTARSHSVNDSRILKWKRDHGRVGKIPVAYASQMQYEEDIDWE